jgi:DNA polymerase III delta prime subunit
MLLPKKKSPPTKKDPKRLLLFGPPKVGKTTIVSALEDCLIVDLEEGSDYVEAAVVKVNSMADFATLIKALKTDKEENKRKPYKHIVIDTLTALEELSIALAVKEYKASPVGANYSGNDVRTLPNGAGYAWTRPAFMRMLKSFEPFCETLIMIGHIKEKDLVKNGETLTEKSINLTGKTKDILCAWSDSIGLVYREDNKTMLDFMPSESLIVGSRQVHLRGAKVVIATSDDKNELTVDWSTVFVEDPREEVAE